MVSLALSWCLLLCGGLVNQANAMQQMLPAATALDEIVLSKTDLTEKVPPCHGQQGDTEVDSASLTAAHDNCSGCETQATQLDPLSLPAMVLLVSWLNVTEIWSVKQPANNWFAHSPPPRPSVPLYLRKNLLLI